MGDVLIGGTPGSPYVAYPDYHPLAMYLVYCKGQDPRFSDVPRLRLHGAATVGAMATSAFGGDDHPLAALPQLEPQFSPKGDAIAFTCVDRGNNDIYV